MALNLDNMNIYNGTYTGGNGTIGGCLNITSEREKFCPRDGKAFDPLDNYCSKCGRAVGYISYPNQILPYYQQPYTITWGQQTTAPCTGTSWNSIAAQQLQQTLDFCGNSEYNGT